MGDEKYYWLEKSSGLTSRLNVIKQCGKRFRTQSKFEGRGGTRSTATKEAGRESGQGGREEKDSDRTLYGPITLPGRESRKSRSPRATTGLPFGVRIKSREFLARPAFSSKINTSVREEKTVRRRLCANV